MDDGFRFRFKLRFHVWLLIVFKYTQPVQTVGRVEVTIRRVFDLHTHTHTHTQ